jgi:hypothetical protein
MKWLTAKGCTTGTFDLLRGLKLERLVEPLAVVALAKFQ